MDAQIQSVDVQRALSAARPRKYNFLPLLTFLSYVRGCNAKYMMLKYSGDAVQSHILSGDTSSVESDLAVGFQG